MTGWDAAVPPAASDGIDVKGVSTDGRAGDRHNRQEADASRWTQPPRSSDSRHCLPSPNTLSAPEHSHKQVVPASAFAGSGPTRLIAHCIVSATVGTGSVTMVTSHGNSGTARIIGVPKPIRSMPKGSLRDETWWFCTPACRQSSSQLLAAGPLTRSSVLPAGKGIGAGNRKPHHHPARRYLGFSCSRRNTS